MSQECQQEANRIHLANEEMTIKSCRLLKEIMYQRNITKI